jgi:type VI secretion system protein ImpM
MTEQSQQNAFGYFGKLPTLGDFIQQILPQDFANAWHSWLQQCMAEARDSLGEQFLTYYLNCPAWKFLMAPGVCGEQPVAGLTIPSVDKVGRYFNFTLATVLPMNSNPCTYVINNKKGMMEMENLALDILEKDYSKEEIEVKLRDLALHFEPTSGTQPRIVSDASYIRISQDSALPFSDQSGDLISHLLTQQLQNFSMWWYGQVGQTQSQLLVCNGLPSTDVYLNLLTLGDPPEMDLKEMDYIDQIIAGDGQA